jgi:hypothetical protein
MVPPVHLRNFRDELTAYQLCQLEEALTVLNTNILLRTPSLYWIALSVDA